MRFVYLSTLLFLTTICRAQEQPDLVSTTTSALTKQYSTEISQATETITKRSRQALAKWGISREYIEPTVVFAKVLIERKVEYRHKLGDFYLGGESVDSFAGIRVYLTTDF